MKFSEIQTVPFESEIQTVGRKHHPATCVTCLIPAGDDVMPGSFVLLSNPFPFIIGILLCKTVLWLNDARNVNTNFFCPSL